MAGIGPAVAPVGYTSPARTMSICVTVHGFVEPARVLRRDAAQAGDDVWLSGTLGDAAGSQHLIGGQMQDLLSEKKSDATQAELEYIHLNKTAAMIEASLVMGGLCGGATPTQAETLRTAGRHALRAQATCKSCRSLCWH